MLGLVGFSIQAQKTEPHISSDGSMFHGANQYDFAIILPGSGLECFWHFAHQSGRFYLTYMVQWTGGMSGDRRLHVSVLSPEGKEVTSMTEPFGQINFQTQTTGFYQMCFGNFVNKFANVQVYLDFGVFYDGLDDVKIEEEVEDEKELNSTITGIQVSVDKLRAYVVHMWRYYNYGRMKRATDHFLLETKSNYITWWSAAQSLVIIIVGYVQLFIIKRLFHSQDTRPRC